MAKSRQILSEGGNAVDGVSRINKANVEATVEDFYSKVLPLFKITKKSIVLLGSAGKKETSGDIDIGFNYYSCNCNSIVEFIDKAAEVAKSIGIEYTANYGLKEASYRWPISDVDGKQAGQYV